MLGVTVAANTIFRPGSGYSVLIALAIAVIALAAHAMRRSR